MPTNTKINLLKSDFQFAHFFLFLTYYISNTIILNFSPFYQLNDIYFDNQEPVVSHLVFNLTSIFVLYLIQLILFSLPFNEISTFSNNSHLGWSVWKLHII